MTRVDSRWERPLVADRAQGAALWKGLSGAAGQLLGLVLIERPRART